MDTDDWNCFLLIPQFRKSEQGASYSCFFCDQIFLFEIDKFTYKTRSQSAQGTEHAYVHRAKNAYEKQNKNIHGRNREGVDIITQDKQTQGQTTS